MISSVPSSAASRRTARLSELRERIAALEQRPLLVGAGDMPGQGQARCRQHQPDRKTRIWRTGIDVLDRALPDTGLAMDGLHEVTAATAADRPAALAFLAALLARLDRNGMVPICQGPGSIPRLGRLYGPGWHSLGMDPADLVIVEAGHERDALWAMEESLRSGAAAAVLGETERLAFVGSRRLSLAGREGRTPLLLLRGDGMGGASAATTRWRVTALPGSSHPFDTAAPGLPHWHLELLRCRGGRPASCIVEWNRETGDFGMVAALANRSVAPDAGWYPAPAVARAAG